MGRARRRARRHREVRRRRCRPTSWTPSARTAWPSRAPSPPPSARASGASTWPCARSSDLYACLRPCKSYPGVRSRYQDIDLVIVRENTEDLYAGIEFEEGHARDAPAHRDHRRAGRPAPSAPTPASASSPSRVFGSRRIVRFAFEYARANGAAQGHRRPQGQHHEVHRRALPGSRPRGGPGVPGHRVRGPHRGQHVHAARPEARALRRAGAAQPLRRHPQRPLRRAGRRPGRRARRQHRRRHRPLRGHPRLRPQDTRA